MKFKFGDYAHIKNLNPELDGIVVQIVGLSNEVTKITSYIVENCDHHCGCMFNYPDGSCWSNIIISETFLEKVDYKNENKGR